MTDFIQNHDQPPESATRVEVLVGWLLRVMGGIVVLAIVPVFFPASWMKFLHELAELGAIPDQPIFWYLTRSLSLMYFAHGVFVFALSTNVRRYWPLIQLLCVLNLVIGLILIGIDLNASMPWWWTIAEGPGIIAGGILLLILVRKQERKKWETTPK
jgi:hypothetical protein